jgi:hypothetical protein
MDDIAGICNENRNVVGLMPHPERASNPLLGSDDGLVLLRSLLAASGSGPAHSHSRISLGAQPNQRVMPAFLSTSADTPASRQTP